ncbi:hypothetical protein ACDA63_09925 [Uliginosibacterium sp. sgz301328]|uniref:hypothetical protein n=1 Tax=Uliginosibacterium sp. sgz301328 TaxID=3243764 RepID=UPI00359D2B49
MTKPPAATNFTVEQQDGRAGSALQVKERGMGNELAGALLAAIEIPVDIVRQT